MKEATLSLLNFQRENGQPVEPVGLAFQMSVPTNAARGRESDQLLAYLVLTGNSQTEDLAPEGYKKLIADTFYQFSGPLTSALKSTVEKINQHLMDSNLRSTGKGEFRFGCLVLCAVQNQKITIVQAGPSRAYKVGIEVKEFFDPTLAGKGLGISPTPKMYFAQTSTIDGDKVIITLEQPKEWKLAIEQLGAGLPAESIMASLCAATGEDVAGLVVSIGQVQVAESAREMPHVTGKSDPAPQSIEAPVFSDQTPDQIPARLPRPVRRELKPRNVQVNAPSVDWHKIAATLLSLLRTIRSSSGSFSEKIEDNLVHILPERSTDQPLKVWSQKLGMITAIILPAIVLVMAQLVYSNVGFDARYNEYVGLARAQYAQATTENDAVTKRASLISAVDWLKKAEQSAGQLDNDTQGMRTQVLAALDELNKVQRLAFSPSLTQALPAGSLQSKIAASNSDLFLLDGAGSKVSRYISNGRSFDEDKGFTCTSGDHPNANGESISIGRLVDIAALVQAPKNPAILLAIDENMHLLYCSPTGDPTAAALAIPDLGIKQVSNIALFDHTLFVLDKVGKGVYVYYGTNDWEFSDQPGFAFSEQIPNSMETATGFVVGSDSLSLIFSDGHITNCSFSHSAGVAQGCEDPKPLTDTRPGFGGAVDSLAEVHFSQILATQQPNASVLLLDAPSRSVYVFSPNYYELQKQLLSLGGAIDPVPQNKEALLMAVSPGKTLFLLIDNQIYSAVLK